MRTIVGSAAVMIGVTLLVPWQRLPKAAFTVVLFLMTVHVAALADAAGSAGSSMMILLAFVVVIAAYFLPARYAIGTLAMVVAVVALRVLTIDDAASRQTEALRMTLLAAALVALCGLVIALRRGIHRREELIKSQGVYDYQTGLLSASELNRVVDTELSRAARHARPLSLVMIQLSGGVFEEVGTPHVARLLTMVARSVLGRIRVEDSAARLDLLRFAIVAPETPVEGAAAFAEMLSEVIRKRLVTLGYDSESFQIKHSFADYPSRAQNREQLLELAAAGLESFSPARASAPVGVSGGIREPNGSGRAPATFPPR
jgi:GGDEF domain-containing protein